MVELSGIRPLVKQCIFIIGGIVACRLESSMLLGPTLLLAGSVVALIVGLTLVSED